MEQEKCICTVHSDLCCCNPSSLIGKKLPDITLNGFHKDDIRGFDLSSFEGKWVLLFFYPADFTFVCPTELEEMADLYEEFKNLDCEVLSVSTDTEFVHKAWHDHSPAIKKVDFPMLGDPTGQLCKALGTYIENEGLSYRATFIVDPKGEIVAYEINHNDFGRRAKDMLRKLEVAQFAQKNPGNVCPASWKPGSETLKPGVDLIGKI